jgi:hypothetical protein
MNLRASRRRSTASSRLARPAGPGSLGSRDSQDAARSWRQQLAADQVKVRHRNEALATASSSLKRACEPSSSASPQVLGIVYHVLRDGQTYRELGGDYVLPVQRIGARTPCSTRAATVRVLSVNSRRLVPTATKSVPATSWNSRTLPTSLGRCEIWSRVGVVDRIEARLSLDGPTRELTCRVRSESTPISAILASLAAHGESR